MPEPESFPVVIEPSGWQFAAAPDVSILRAAALADIKLPSSCRNGTCRACMCMLGSGQVSYPLERPGLSRDERDEGWILPCVARAMSPLTIQAPKARPLDKPTAAPQMLTGARR